ncbi:MAG TPA: outer membrane protein assembly factor BamD [Gemmatimonadaceae bacterium]|nr:outer membrane protein assembly factor BamD [Gemmatimonadaceae bacterium]
MPPSFRSVAAALLLLGSAACASGFQAARYTDNEALYTAALAEYERGEWDNAVAGFERLTLMLPARDTLLPRSHYYLGQAHRRRGEELLAAQSFVRLVEAFPNDTLADDALYDAALSYQRLWRKPELDPQYGEAAMETYRTLLSAYPNSPLRDETERGIRELQEMMATKDLRTGEYYLRLRAYDSAIIYFQDVQKEYPETDAARRAGLRLVDTYRRLYYREEVAETCATLRQRHPDDGGVRESCGQPPAAAADSTD